MTYWRELARHYDHVFTIQTDACLEAMAQVTDARLAYLPCGFDPRVHRPLVLDRRGAGRVRQRRLVRRRRLSQSAPGVSPLPRPRLPHLGQRLGRRRRARRASSSATAPASTPRTSVRIFNASRVNLNLHSSTYHEGVDPRGDFVNPRTFELAGAGAFQIVDQRRLLPPLFTAGDELAVASERRRRCGRSPITTSRTRTSACAMAGRARQRALAEHSYTRRLEDMLAAIIGPAQERLLGRRPTVTVGDVRRGGDGAARALPRALRPAHAVHARAPGREPRRSRGRAQPSRRRSSSSCTNSTSSTCGSTGMSGRRPAARRRAHPRSSTSRASAICCRPRPRSRRSSASIPARPSRLMAEKNFADVCDEHSRASTASIAPSSIGSAISCWRAARSCSRPIATSSGVIGELRAERFDLALNYSSSRMSAVFMGLLADSRRARLVDDARRLARDPPSVGAALRDHVPNRRVATFNLVDYYCAMTGSLADTRRLQYDGGAGGRPSARAALLAKQGIGGDERVVAMQLGASRAIRQWPEASFVGTRTGARGAGLSHRGDRRRR